MSDFSKFIRVRPRYTKKKLKAKKKTVLFNIRKKGKEENQLEKTHYSSLF